MPRNILQMARLRPLAAESCQRVSDRTETLPSTPDSPCRVFLEPGYSHTLTLLQYLCLTEGIR